MNKASKVILTAAAGIAVREAWTRRRHLPPELQDAARQLGERAQDAGSRLAWAVLDQAGVKRAKPRPPTLFGPQAAALLLNRKEDPWTDTG